MLRANKTAHERFLHAYIETALWSSTGDDGEPLDSVDHQLAEETVVQMEKDCLAFWCANAEHIEDEPRKAGHDFWLTRCGHGAGFWDGDWPEPDASILDSAAKAFGNVDLYVGDDGQIYCI
ncbi:hypothetical protein [Rhizobium leguminosarum]|uniref:hypothetical protein n=1 Tax=Rhizobium leguminosarum TaxID=384 RepID=UPI000488F13E|nr:hypothetical protein [Rhizobium leguminosarum]